MSESLQGRTESLSTSTQRGSGAKPPEAESLANIGNWTDGTNLLQLDEH